MKIWVAKPSKRCGVMLNCFSDCLVQIDLAEFWKQHDIDDKEYFLEQFIKAKLEASNG